MSYETNAGDVRRRRQSALVRQRRMVEAEVSSRTRGRKIRETAAPQQAREVVRWSVENPQEK